MMEKNKLLAYVDENSTKIRIWLTIFLIIFFIFMVVEVRKEVDAHQYCTQNGLTYEYSMSCYNQSTFGRVYWKAHLNWDGTKFMKYTGYEKND